VIQIGGCIAPSEIFFISCPEPDFPFVLTLKVEKATKPQPSTQRREKNYERIEHEQPGIPAVVPQQRVV
jgi:hypothetical protein